MLLQTRPLRVHSSRTSSRVSPARSLVTAAAAAAAAVGPQPQPRSMSSEHELLKLSSDLLQSIADRDWDKYAELCDEKMTAFEPEAAGHLVEGLPFHRFYFDLLLSRDSYKPPQNTISQPHVRMLGADAAVVSYIRLQQKIDGAGRPLTISTEETRVWQKVGGKWKNVHFHRSPTTPSA